jgi:transcriptional regulator with XRE-family HTH domain
MTGQISAGTELRRLRRERGLSLARLAALVQYSKGHLSKVETGIQEPTAALLAQCDEVLDTGGALRRLARPRAARDRRPVPAQVPPAPELFGRTEIIARLLAGLDRPGPVVLVHGAGGVGKTALAVAVAHRVRRRFPDGVLLVDLRGHDPAGQAADPAEVLDRFLRALGTQPPVVPTDPAGRAALLRTTLAGRRVLLVLDNAASVAQVRPLLPDAPGCATLVTSRFELPGLCDPHRYPLEPLPAADAVTLLRAGTGVDRAAAGPGTLDALAGWCRYLPLALRIAAAHPSALADGWGAERSVFSWSYRALPAERARAFALLGLHPGPDIGLPAAAALFGTAAPEALRLLDALVAARLLTGDPGRRYRLHDLLRAYAGECAAADIPPAEREAALHRLLSWYLHTGSATDEVLNRFATRDPLAPPPPGCAPPRFACPEDALRWYDDERDNLGPITLCANASGYDEIASQLPLRLWTCVVLRQHWDDLTALARLALPAAARLGDPVAEARLVTMLASGYARQGSHAVELLDRAVRRCAWTPDDPSAAMVSTTHGETYLWLGRYDDATGHLTRALAAHRHNGNPWLAARVLVGLGRAHHALGQHARATAHYGEALSLHRRLGDRLGQAETLELLGRSLFALGQVPAARDRWRDAILRYEELHDERAERLRACYASAPTSPTTSRAHP